MEKKTLHKTGNSAVTNVALEREVQKKEKKFYNTGYSYLVISTKLKM